MSERYDLEVDRYTDWEFKFTWQNPDTTPIDLTGWGAHMHVAKSYSVPTPVLDRSTAAGTIVLGGVLGTVTVSLSAAETALLTPGSYVYDLLMINPSSKTSKLLYGMFKVNPGVTTGAH